MLRGVCSIQRTNAHKILVGKLEGKRPFGRPVRRWEDNTIIDFTQIV